MLASFPAKTSLSIIDFAPSCRYLICLIRTRLAFFLRPRLSGLGRSARLSWLRPSGSDLLPRRLFATRFPVAGEARCFRPSAFFPRSCLTWMRSTPRVGRAFAPRPAQSQGPPARDRLAHGGARRSSRPARDTSPNFRADRRHTTCTPRGRAETARRLRGRRSQRSLKTARSPCEIPPRARANDRPVRLRTSLARSDQAVRG